MHRGDGALAPWLAAALWVHYPALILFTPGFDQILPLFSLGCLYSAARGMR